MGVCALKLVDTKKSREKKRYTFNDFFMGEFDKLSN
jgi:hypothetical protein